MEEDESLLVAAGGWASPAPVYDLFPAFKAERGGIKYEPFIKLATKDQRFLDMASGVALESECKFRHGAVVVKHGHVLGSATNVQKNDPKFVDFKHSQIHAEIAAMKKAGWPNKATIYVARVNGNGQNRLSKPCANCQEVLDQFKTKVVFTQ